MNKMVVNEKFLKENRLEELKNVFVYLEDLRQSGAVNMIGARSYIANTFPQLSKEDVDACFMLYINSYNDLYIQED